MLEILKLFKKDKTIWPKSEFYEESKEIHRQLKFHSTGKWDDKYIGFDRPGEPEECKQLRIDIWESPTKDAWAKILNVCGRIRLAEDWAIIFPENNKPGYKEYKEYCTTSYPYDDSLENYYFTVIFPRKLDSPNDLVVVEPVSTEIKSNEFFMPWANIYETEKVLIGVEGVWYFLHEGTIQLEDGEGYVFKYVDKKVIIIYTQIGKRDNWSFEVNEIVHNFNYVPAFRLGGVPKKTTISGRLYESPLSPCCSSFNEACRRASDVQVNYIRHMNPDRWEIQDTDCPTCDGKGTEYKDIGNSKRKVVCRSCKGSGMAPSSPFRTKYYRASSGDMEKISNPIPPMGYVTRDTKVIELQESYVEKKIQKAYGSINMEYLSTIPLAESGIAKGYDRQDSNSFMYRLIQDVVDNNLIPLYYFTAKWMLYKMYPESVIMEMIPKINKPKKLDFLNSDLIAMRAQQATSSGFSQLVLLPMQLTYAKIELGEDSVEYKRLKAINTHDPFAAKTQDEKLAITQNVRKRDIILSDNIYSFIVRAEKEDDKFYDKNYFEQQDVLYKYVEEIEKELEVKVPVDVQSV